LFQPRPAIPLGAVKQRPPLGGLTESSGMPEPTDDELVARSRTGDDEAFAVLVTRYRARVFGLIGRTIGDPARADDLAQDVFLRIHRGLPYFRGRSKLSTWIYRIVVNVCLQEAGRPVRIEVPAETPGDEDHAPRELAVRDPAFEAVELRDRLEKALATLPPNYRLLVAAHYLQGVQYEDLADAMQMPLGTVKTHLHRARQLLRRALTEAAVAPVRGRE
jgi:RNA polymerase sigma-70 factor (ECF subfamily)